jgi:hypothetical protein
MSKKPLLQIITHHRQNPLDFIYNISSLCAYFRLEKAFAVLLGASGGLIRKDWYVEVLYYSLNLTDLNSSKRRPTPHRVLWDLSEMAFSVPTTVNKLCRLISGNSYFFLYHILCVLFVSFGVWCG